MKSCPACQATYPNNYAVCPQDGTPLVDVTAWSPGTVIRGKYRVLSKVGQGGMGAVYKAVHVAFDESRALKVISRELMSDELFVKRFKHEAVITRRLQHPNAVRVDDIDEAEDGRPFIVMEYIEGQSLKKLIQEQGALPVPRACAIAKQVAAALDAAHRLGMVHRDIKPDNIVLIDSPEGERAKVLDFGIAKVKEGRLGETGGMTLTGTGVVIGTPQYMSPEQAMGKRGDELDGRSDLYSLGIVMYQMLTGDLPFKADTSMEMLLAHLQRPPTPIRVLRPELQIPDAVANLVMKMLEKDREKRPAGGAELIVALEHAESELAAPGETRVIRPTVVVGSQPPAAPPQPAARPRPSAPASPGTGAVAPAAPVPRPPAPPVQQARAPAAARPVPPTAVPKKASPAVPVVIAVSLILGVGAGGGIWYFTHQPVAVRETVVPASPPTASPGVSPAASSQPTAPAQQPVTSAPGPTGEDRPASSAPSEIAKPQAPTGAESRRPSGVASRPTSDRSSQPTRSAADDTRIKQALTLGNFHFNRGEYDAAIAEYQRGLTVDPGHAELRNALQRARTAKQAEERVLE